MLSEHGGSEGYLQEQASEVFFLLYAAIGEAAYLDFLAWLLENRPAYGAIVGDSISDPLSINALNSALVVDALLRPVSAARWRKMLARRVEHSGGEARSPLRQLKGNVPCWYTGDKASEREPGIFDT